MTDSIMVEAGETEGLAEYVDLQLQTAGEEFGGADDRRAHCQYMLDLLELEEELLAGEPATFTTKLETLRSLARDGAESSRERFGEALDGRTYGDRSPTVLREAEGLMALGHRLGVYDGPVAQVVDDGTAA